MWINSALDAQSLAPVETPPDKFRSCCYATWLRPLLNRQMRYLFPVIAHDLIARGPLSGPAERDPAYTNGIRDFQLCSGGWDIQSTAPVYVIHTKMNLELATQTDGTAATVIAAAPWSAAGPLDTRAENGVFFKQYCFGSAAEFLQNFAFIVNADLLPRL